MHYLLHLYNNSNTTQQPFCAPLSGATRVSWYQNKHSPTHHPDNHPIFISFFHLPRSIASSLFKLRTCQSSCTTSFHVLFGLPLGLALSTSYSIHFFTQSLSSFRSTCPQKKTLIGLRNVWNMTTSCTTCYRTTSLVVWFSKSCTVLGLHPYVKIRRHSSFVCAWSKDNLYLYSTHTRPLIWRPQPNYYPNTNLNPITIIYGSFYYLQCPEKGAIIFLHLTVSKADRFSKFFHRQT